MHALLDGIDNGLRLRWGELVGHIVQTECPVHPISTDLDVVLAGIWVAVTTQQTATDFQKCLLFLFVEADLIEDPVLSSERDVTGERVRAMRVWTLCEEVREGNLVSSHLVPFG